MRSATGTTGLGLTMATDPTGLIFGYLDDLLDEEQQRELNDWVKRDPRHARQFVEAALLHDRLLDQFPVGLHLGGDPQAAGEGGLPMCGSPPAGSPPDDAPWGRSR